MIDKTQHFICLAAQAIFDRKGFNILGIDMTGTQSMADYYLIAEGNVGRHVSALAEYVVETLEKEGERPVHREGESRGDWVVLDYGNFIIHILIPDMREKYTLEKMWSAGDIVDLKIKVMDVSHG
jgi:ribosome-associated protein